jgi:hypothetical protein
MPTTPNRGYPYQARSDPPDGAALGELLALAVDADMAEVMATIGPLDDPWPDYTSAWTTTGTPPAIGDGSIIARFLQLAGLTLWRVSFLAGAATTFGTGGWSFSLPAVPRDSRQSWSGFVDDASTGNRYALRGLHDAGLVEPWVIASPMVRVTATAPMTWAAVDRLQLQGWFED